MSIKLEVSEIGSMVRLDFRLTPELLEALTLACAKSEQSASRNAYVEDLLWSVEAVASTARQHNIVRKARPPRGKPQYC